MASSRPSYKTTYHTITLSQKTTPRSRPPPALPNLQICPLPQVKVTINVTEHAVRCCGSSLDGVTTVKHVTTRRRPETQARDFDIVTFFVTETAEDAIHEMLADMRFASSKREFLARYLSRFAHRAAAEAGKKLIDGLELAFDFKLEDVWEYEYEYAEVRVTGPVVDASIDLASPPTSSPDLDENGCGREREFPASCPVCLEDFFFPDCIGQELMCTPCFHVFHQRCIGGWLKDTCPVCRSNLRLS